MKMIECKKCGLCCKTYPIDVVESDIQRWNKEERKDILREVSFVNNYPKKGYGGFYVEKSLRSPKEPCPFFKDNLCSIYETRPLVCKNFPNNHIESVCPMHKYDSWKKKKLSDSVDKEMNRTKKYFNHLMSILIEARK